MNDVSRLSALPPISLVVAMARNGVIGRQGRLPWHLPSELRHFKQATLGKAVVMGRKTWQSLPRKPLPGRLNIILSRDAGFQAEGGVVVSDLPAAFLAAHAAPEIAIIGGGEIFAQALHLAHRIYLTIIDLDVAGDTFFPKLDTDLWRESSRHDQAKLPDEVAGYTVLVYERNLPVSHNL